MKIKRKYTKEDIYDYLLENYGLAWNDFRVYSKTSTRKVKESDFVSDRFSADILLFEGEARNRVHIKMSNNEFGLWGIEPKTDVSWTEFLAQRHANKQGLSR